MARSLGGKLIKTAIGIGLTVYFLTLVIVRVPATFVTVNLAKAVPDLHLSVVSGSAWKGKVGDAAINVQGQIVQLGALKWTFKPLSLLAFKVCVDLESAIASGNVCRTLTGINQLHKVQLEFPASMANRFTGEAQLAGLTSLNLVRAAVNDKGEVSALNGNFSWRGARVNVQGMWFTLGDFAADLTEAPAGAINANIFDLAGPFGVKLNAQLGVNTAPTAKGEILPKDGAQEDIKDVLGLFAVPQESGSYVVSYPLGG